MLRSLLPLPVLTIAALAIEGTIVWEPLPPLPDALGVAAPFAGVSGGALLVAGGANFPKGKPWEGGRKVWHDQIWVLEKPDGAWRSAGKLPHPLAYGVSVTWRGGVICVGGSDAERHYSDAFRLVWENGSLAIEPLPPLPIRISGASGALLNDTLFVACGSEEPGERAASNRVFALDLATAIPAWHELAALPESPRLLATGTVYDGAFYLFGGAALEPSAQGGTVRAYLSEAWRYRAETGWKRVADLPKPSVGAPSPAPVIGGRLVLPGGDDGSLVNFQPLEKHPGFPKATLIYDPAIDRWSEGSEIPAPRATAPCVEWQGRFVIPSGEVRPGVRSPEVWALRPR